MSCYIKVLHEAKIKQNTGYTLCFQWGECRYPPTKEVEHGYRFIYRDPAGNLRPQRGQARLPSLKLIRKLLETAEEEGWGGYEGES
jgi:hypothetical protein